MSEQYKIISIDGVDYVEAKYARKISEQLEAAKTLIQLKGGWIKSSDRLPEYNISVLVYIPEEDHHITTGMWDVSKKWVLLDEYRIPKSEVTYWRPMVEKPLDDSYTSAHLFGDDIETMPEQISRLQKENFKQSQTITQQKEEIERLNEYLKVETNLHVTYKNALDNNP